MKKLILFLILSFTLFANNGIVGYKELMQAGVSKENIIKSQKLVKKTFKTDEMLIIQKNKKELEIKELLVNYSDEHWNEISELLDEISVIEAKIKKNKLKSQIDLRKLITEDQYKKARKLAEKKD